MGKSKKLKFHIFEIKNIATLIVVEPKSKVYVWIYLFLEKPLRNGATSTELTKYVLYYLKGVHHIHWLSNLKSFQFLSKELKWKTKSKSDFFEDCKYSQTISLKSQSNLFPLFKVIVSHKVSSRKPTSLIYALRKDENIILSNIKKMFT